MQFDSDSLISLIDMFILARGFGELDTRQKTLIPKDSHYLGLLRQSKSRLGLKAVRVAWPKAKAARLKTSWLLSN
ncbi:hypothetical protein [Moorena producens]|uniref:hypothetical protein n=1 Tax=Moorena producens TaxID=1155739 RepID=UPI001314718D|nr:hypothetical protein [Moorena producens]